MNTTKTLTKREELLSKIISFPYIIQGKICEDKRKLADGSITTYHNLQYWHNGKNHTQRIPEDKVADFKKAIENGQKAKELLFNIGKEDIKQILGSDSSVKKKRTK